MKFKLSHHRSKHSGETWNAETISNLFMSGKVPTTILEGKTADVQYGTAPDGQVVGLILSKPRAGATERIVITGFAASEEYWKSV